MGRMALARRSVEMVARFGSRRLTFEQVIWVVIGLLVALFFWLLISGETMAGRGWT